MQQEKIVRAMYMGHELVARNFWKMTRDEFATEATLAFDGTIVARTSEVSHRKAKLQAMLRDGDTSHAVKVSFGGFIRLRMKIMVDGQKVGGDLK
jgi:hypothetical protein